MDSVEKVNEYLFKFKKEKTKVEISKDKKGAKDKLQELLLSNDYNQINLGLDLAKSISDFEIFGHLLHGVQLINNQIIPNSTFLGNDKNKAFLTYALEGLLSVAPKDIEVAELYRKSLKTKEIRGAHFTSLISISGLEHLESLTIAESGITVFSDTSKLQNLEKLVLTKNAGLKDLSGLKELKKLKSIQIENCGIADLKGFTDLMHLESIEISACIGLQTTDGIMNLPALAKIRIEFCTNLENIDALGNLSKLNEISLSYCPSIQQLKPLTKLYALQVLKVDKHKLSNLDGISELIKPILEGLRG
jgi:Leucine-rich repeat (LRR) protein